MFRILKDAATDPLVVGIALVSLVLGGILLVALVARVVGEVVAQWSW